MHLHVGYFFPAIARFFSVDEFGLSHLRATHRRTAFARIALPRVSPPSSPEHTAATVAKDHCSSIVSTVDIRTCRLSTPGIRPSTPGVLVLVMTKYFAVAEWIRACWLAGGDTHHQGSSPCSCLFLVTSPPGIRASSPCLRSFSRNVCCCPSLHQR